MTLKEKHVIEHEKNIHCVLPHKKVVSEEIFNQWCTELKKQSKSFPEYKTLKLENEILVSTCYHKIRTCTFSFV